jgi:hypothetical protein
MQEMRHGEDGKSWLCMADDCDNTATHGWAQATEDGTKAVEACEKHKLDDDLAALLHGETCQAPPECTCKAKA